MANAHIPRRREPAATILDIKAALEPITREVNDLREELRTMRKILIGNGAGIGLDEQVRANAREIERHAVTIKAIPEIDKRLDAIESHLRFQNKITWLVITAGGGYVIVEFVKFVITNI